MTLPRRLTLLALTVAVAAVAAATTAASPDTGTTARATPAITSKGVGKVRLGSTYRSLRRAGLIGKSRPGCELAGPRARSAKLRGPLKGHVDLAPGKRRRVTHVSIRGGAAARGVTVGDTEDDVLQEYPKADVDTSTQDRFGVTIVRIPKTDGGRMEFVIGAEDRVTSIDLPGVSFCE